MIYIFENEKKLEQIKNVLPRSTSVTVALTTIDDIVKSCSEGNYPSLKLIK